MTLTYHDVMTTDLSTLLLAADEWDRMGKRFGVLQGDYEKNVQGALRGDGSSWIGIAFDAQQIAAAQTAYEYGAAQTEAATIAGILRDAHTELSQGQKVVHNMVADAKEDGFAVDSNGVVRYTGFDDLTPADKHDPDYPKLLRQWNDAADQRTADIRKAVQDVDDSDQGVQLALATAAVDTSPDGSGVGGFNANAANPAGTGGDGDPQTHTDGWTRSGSTSSSGFKAGTTGSLFPKAGKEMSFKAYADLFTYSAQGKMTKGGLTLSGTASATEEARVFYNFGLTNEGLKAQAEASAAVRASAEGHETIGDLDLYTRAYASAGAEVSDNLLIGPKGVTSSVKAFVGEKIGGATGAEVGGIGAGATYDAKAGIGAEAKATFGMDPDTGKFKVGGEVGLTLGLGGDVGFEFTVDPKKFTHAASQVASVGESAAHGLGNAAKSAGHALKSVSHLGGLL